MAQLIIPEHNFTVDSETKFRIPADVQGAAKPAERKLIWSEPNGCIDNGMFTAPKVTAPTAFIVNIQMVEDTSQTDQVTINVNPKKVAKKIGDIKAWKHGVGRNYFVTVQVLDTEDKGMKARIKISEDNNVPIIQRAAQLNQPAGPVEFDTDDYGSLTVPLNSTTGKDCVLHVQAMGSEKEKTVFLSQPEKPRCPNCDSSKWNGRVCKTCGFPKTRNPI